MDQYIQINLEKSLIELIDFCRIPSISAQSRSLPEGAQKTAQMLEQRGFATRIVPTQGAPVVVADRAGKSERTLLFYNHYDVQPAEPLELWDSPPFEPQIRDGCLYARGVMDDKGHITSRLLALDAILSVERELPCHVKFCIEGEEETSSVHLHEFMAANHSDLQADACVWEFGSVDHRDIPMQYLGLRGICYVELSVETASSDVHSGVGGSIFPNAAWRLTWALNSLKDTQERILLPNFYSRVRKPSSGDLALLDALPGMMDEYRSRYGVKGFLPGIEEELELKVSEVFRPTCTICGLTSGYQGAGSKTVLPCQASAKIDFRLVPDQTPEEVVAQLRTHLDAGGFQDVHIKVLGQEAPARTDPDDPFVKMVVESAREVYGCPMQVVPMTGGSGPNNLFIRYLHLPVVTAGVGYPGSNAHAPNEHIRIADYENGARHIARIITQFSGQ